eukprot:9099644-Pyramimonas_sp.AAC.1
MTDISGGPARVSSFRTSAFSAEENISMPLLALESPSSPRLDKFRNPAQKARRRRRRPRRRRRRRRRRQARE